MARRKGPYRRTAARSSSGDRMLAVLALFTVEQPQWTVEAAAAELGV